MARLVGAGWGVRFRRVVAGGVIVLLAAGVALVAERCWPVSLGVRAADNVFYDTFYRLRPVEDRSGGPVVIIAIDNSSLEWVDQKLNFGWPWPRQFWGFVAQYLQRCGARAVVFDLMFDQTSVYQHSDDDDDNFAAALSDVHVPVIFGSMVSPGGQWDRLAPPIASPKRGAVNVLNDAMVRSYPPTVDGQPSLALAAIEAAGWRARLPTDRPFLLHYYGPNQIAAGQHTFHYLPARSALAGALPSAAAPSPIPVDELRGKIVLIGAITAGTYDLKSSPLSAQYPGVEVHATAIENLLAGQRVMPVSGPWQDGAPFLVAAVATAGVLIPRRAWVKMLAPVVAVGSVIGVAAMLFNRAEIRWLAPAAPLLAIALATVAAFAWTYLLEDRQRRFMLSALSKVVSPAIAEELSRNPQRLALGTIRTNITLLFTDLANFTGLSETMPVEQVSSLLNRYLSEMSDQILHQQGTLDKYIGDAIMSFWNAPLPQADHAVLACRAALGIVKREEELRAQLDGDAGAKLFTRIGINTTEAAVGFVGSSRLFNYTALGDGVNLASRLEGANKIYGSRILISQSTADLVCNQFVLRKLDVLRVKGKRQPMAVFELLAEAQAGDNRCEELRAKAASYEGAFAHYQNRSFDLAERDLRSALSQYGHDPACDALLERIGELRQQQLDPGWDGVYEAMHK